MSDPVETPRCEGDHGFEDICNACDAAQPSGPCAICPHVGVNMFNRTFGLPLLPPEEAEAATRREHYIRRPCVVCGSADLRTVRVRPPIILPPIVKEHP